MKHTIARVVCRNKTQAKRARGKIRKLFRHEGENPLIDESNEIRGTLHTFRVRLRGRGKEKRGAMCGTLNVAQRLESIENWEFTKR